VPLATPWAPTASKRRQGAGEWGVGMNDLLVCAILRGRAVAVNGGGSLPQEWASLPWLPCRFCVRN
jgi:hypothetical protein